MIVTTTTVDDTKKQLAKLQWRKSTIRHLQQKGFAPVAENFRNCGCSFIVDVCHSNPSHSPKAVPLNCGLRFCEECERRESYRKLSSYLPALQSLLTPNPLYPDHFLFKITLTTPYSLASLTAESFKSKQKLVKDFFDVYFFEYFEKRGQLSKSEIRRGRCDLKRHGIGGIKAAEFGEKGKKLHWHLLVYAPFMPHDDILRIWRHVTGGECQFARVNGIYAKENVELADGGDIIGAIQEIVKYSTKFTTLRPRDVPQLHKVLKGNRRFEAFGILYSAGLKDTEESSHACAECAADRETLSFAQYLSRCEMFNVPVADAVVDVIENGVSVYFSREPEITVGKSSHSHHFARDSIESART